MINRKSYTACCEVAMARLEAVNQELLTEASYSARQQLVLERRRIHDLRWCPQHGELPVTTLERD